jgi:hypothetical protein
MSPHSLQVIMLLVAAFFIRSGGRAEPVAVRHREGEMHGFIELQNLNGRSIAYGEIIQTVNGSRITSRVVFRFLDGSLYDDTAVFSQSNTFRLIRDHLVQKGPSFKEATDTIIDATTGEVSVRYKDKDGRERFKTERLHLPNDIANGMLFIVLKNIREAVPETTVSMVATTPKPRLVKIHISAKGRQVFSVGTLRKEAIHYVLKVEIGGIAGAVAPLIGKQPPDIHAWVAVGAPVVVRSEGPLYADGPIWRVQMARPPIFSDQRRSSRHEKTE